MQRVMAIRTTSQSSDLILCICTLSMRSTTNKCTGAREGRKTVPFTRGMQHYEIVDGNPSWEVNTKPVMGWLVGQLVAS